MRGLYLSLIGCAAVLAVACGGSQPPAETPEPPAPASEPPAASAPAASATPSEADEEAPGAKEDNANDGAGSSDKGDKPEKAAAKEPKFTEGMTVDQAIAAVPQGMARENVDQDELSKPLTDFKVYAPCKPRQNDHFKLKVAIWNGKAVGVDVTTTPKNEKLASCIDKQIRALDWKDPVESLNTIEYSF
jgi:hypothetical protein